MNAALITHVSSRSTINYCCIDRMFTKCYRKSNLPCNQFHLNWFQARSDKAQPTQRPRRRSLKKFIVAVASTISFAVLLALAGNALDAKASGGWSTQGSGTVPTPLSGITFPQKWQWNAHSDVGTAAVGAVATGHFEARNPD